MRPDAECGETVLSVPDNLAEASSAMPDRPGQRTVRVIAVVAGQAVIGLALVEKPTALDAPTTAVPRGQR